MIKTWKEEKKKDLQDNQGLISVDRSKRKLDNRSTCMSWLAYCVAEEQ